MSRPRGPASSNGEESRERGPALRLSALYSGLVQAALFAVVTIPCWWFFAAILSGLPWTENRLVFSIFSQAGAALFTTVLFLKIGAHRPWSALGIDLRRQASGQAGLGFFMGASLAAGVLTVQLAAGWAQVSSIAVDGAIWSGSLTSGFLLLAVGSGGEELLFRGYGLQQLMRAFGPAPAVAATSVAFGLLHAGNPDSSGLGIVNTVLFGLLFGLALVRHRTFWLPFGLHLGWNFALATAGANVSGLTIRLTGYAVTAQGPALWSGGEYGPEGSLLTAVGICLLGIILLRMTALSSGDRLWDLSTRSEIAT